MQTFAFTHTASDIVTLDKLRVWKRLNSAGCYRTIILKKLEEQVAITSMKYICITVPVCCVCVCVYKPHNTGGLIFRVDFFWTSAKLQWAGQRREGGERRAGRMETTPATATCWHSPPGMLNHTHAHTHTHTHTHTAVTSLETALTHEHGVMCDVIWIWCVSSLGQTQIVGFGHTISQSKEREWLVVLHSVCKNCVWCSLEKKGEKGDEENNKKTWMRMSTCCSVCPNSHCLMHVHGYRRIDRRDHSRIILLQFPIPCKG